MTNDLAEKLETLGAEFKRWLDIGPNRQPHYKNGMRPFSTGDLKYYLESLQAACVALRSGRTGGSQPAGDVVERVASSIHDARYLDGRQATNYIPFAQEDDSGREYCLRLARAALSAMPDERGAVVSWLRHLAGEFVTPGILAFFGDPFKRDGQLLCVELADVIERGDHLTHKDAGDG
jgi:hypothetical protein